MSEAHEDWVGVKLNLPNGEQMSIAVKDNQLRLLCMSLMPLTTTLAPLEPGVPMKEVEVKADGVYMSPFVPKPKPVDEALQVPILRRMLMKAMDDGIRDEDEISDLITKRIAKEMEKEK